MIPSSAEISYFLEVANLLNLSRAAENLGISQPSLTLAMQRLEATLGTAILIRHKRGVSLTKAGKHLLAHSRQLLQYWENVKSETLAAMTDIQGSFILGCHSSVALYYLPLFLTPLLIQYPKLEIKLVHDHSRKINDQVINLEVDIGIVVNPIRHPDLVIKKLDDDKVTLWHSSGNNPLQNLHSGQAVILCDPNLHQTQQILKGLKKQGLQYSRLIPSNNLEVIAELTVSGSGIGILPAKIANLRHLIPVPKAPFHLDEICMLYRGENRNVKSIQALATAIKNARK